MAIVSHRHRFIFLKSRKTAGSSIEIWLAPHLDPEHDMAALTADLAVYRPDLKDRFSARGLPAHATAQQVRSIVGEKIWNSYFKFSVERNPFDRILSLWRWRVHHRAIDLTLDEFLAAILDGSAGHLKAAGAQDWSNWPIYAAGDSIVLDHVARYENLGDELARTFAQVGLEFDGHLVNAKSGVRRPTDVVDSLTSSQIAIISQLFRREISLFGYKALAKTNVRPPTTPWKLGEPAGDRYRGQIASTYLAARVGKPVWHAEHEAVRKLLQRIPDNTSLIDVPFGTGRFVPLYAEKGMTVTGIDSSPDMLEVARHEIGPAFDEMDIRVGDALALPFPNASFAVAVCVRFLDSIIPSRMVVPCLMELRRVTRSFAIVRLNNRIDGERSRPIDPDQRLGGRVTLEGLIALLAEAGWSLAESVIVDRSKDGKGEKRICLLQPTTHGPDFSNRPI